MADEPPPIDFEEEAPEKEEEEEVQLHKTVVTEKQPPPLQQAAQEDEEEEDRTREEPPSLGAEPEPPWLTEVPKPLSSAPPPTLEARAVDEGDDSEPVRPVVQPARTLDLFEEEPPEQKTSQVGREREEGGM